MEASALGVGTVVRLGWLHGFLSAFLVNWFSVKLNRIWMDYFQRSLANCAIDKVNYVVAHVRLLTVTSVLPVLR